MYKESKNLFVVENVPIIIIVVYFYEDHKLKHYIKKNYPQSIPTCSQTIQLRPSNRISFVEKLYSSEERHASLSETLTLAHRYVHLSEPFYEQTYNIYPSKQQNLNRTRHSSQNQNPTTINGGQKINSDAMEP